MTTDPAPAEILKPYTVILHWDAEHSVVEHTYSMCADSAVVTARGIHGDDDSAAEVVAVFNGHHDDIQNEVPSAASAAHIREACPSNHWNDGNDTCADCGADLQV